ncbi:hypothetical protein [Draconibacterium halophilum]|uniref:Lipoprotein n=1 Tax=Draconibacterium halophilum TaxID=2706887 RepID=A0A6C0RI88_9BACT|nr:hypothetical protein [Draconibacterium halophilum]QIA08831.1 hypothetical protein G0Q07_14370 [Draconibacterium halophilum]
MKKTWNFYFNLAQILLLSSFVSCNNYKEKTFLDFEFGMTYNEYINHARSLQKSGFISNLNGTDFDYTIKLSENEFVFFRVHAYVYSNSRLSMISADSKYDLNDKEKEQLYKIFVANRGQTTEPYRKSYSENIWRAIWDYRNTDTRIVFVDKDEDGEWETSINYMATGNLRDRIDRKDKKENGIIDVKNKY